MRVPLQHLQGAVAVGLLAVLVAGSGLPPVDLPDLGSLGVLGRLVVAVFVLALVGGLLDALAQPPAPPVNRVRSGDAAD